MIEFRNVSKHYGRTRALDDVTMDLPSGSIIGLFGPNGAGKSTTLKLISGLARPSQGQVLVDGRLPRANRGNIAYLPEVSHLYSWWTLGQAANYIRAFYGDWDDERYEKNLGFLRLDPGMKLARISRGQLAKAKLLLTVSRKARYLLMDEPFSGIDILTRDEIIDALIRDYSEGEQTVIISTHEINEIENMVDYVVFINRGRIQLAGDAEDLREARGLSLVDIMKEEFRNAQ